MDSTDRQNADTEFVHVGAAHIVGENGLLDLLAQKGYEVNQL
ncbi:MAG: TraB/GumN family protein [Gammaproteobacteria bacterium]|nr:TraB/GumN family protein [Gammaproteobacteria bacterium]MDG2337166.1 TraB/GumN family protein [Gammaproteobacteria bacterium]